eukprot:TRINITY_DN22568_c0_g1_i1.p1 TRINITY_DN22568_c0_g1~~TRINITY_DN22568_c0_g1_i1.p1  ORF type:complete len:777 (+),score=152.72 TRINITY_DN22568_c0_g1_i1:48-2378(+)
MEESQSKDDHLLSSDSPAAHAASTEQRSVPSMRGCSESLASLTDGQLPFDELRELLDITKRRVDDTIKQLRLENGFLRRGVPEKSSLPQPKGSSSPCHQNDTVPSGQGSTNPDADNGLPDLPQEEEDGMSNTSLQAEPCQSDRSLICYEEDPSRRQDSEDLPEITQQALEELNRGAMSKKRALEARTSMRKMHAGLASARSITLLERQRSSAAKSDEDLEDDDPPDVETFEMWPALSQLSGQKGRVVLTITGNLDVRSLTSGKEDSYCSWLKLASPVSGWSLAWDVASLFLIAYDFVMVPLLVFEIPDFIAFAVMDWILRIFWTFSIPRGFYVGAINRDGEIVLSPAKVARRYFFGWFFLDLAFVVNDWAECFIQPAEFVGTARAAKSTRMVRVIRVLRLARMFKLPALVQKFTEFFISEKVILLIGILKMVVLFVGLCHLIACIWYGIGSLAVDGKSWILFYRFDEESAFYCYMTSVHWSVTQFTGTMHVEPKNVAERCYAVFILILSFVLAAGFISRITASITRLQLIAGTNETQFMLLGQYLHFRKVSSNLAMRVMKSARFAAREREKDIMEKDVSLLSMISEPLRIEIHYEIYAPVLMSHPFFQHYNFVNKAAMHQLCHRGVSTLSLNTGDLLFHPLEIPKVPRMFFLQSGFMSYKCEVVFREVTELQIVPGMSFCEASLWMPKVHEGSLIAESNCTLLALDADKFHHVVREFRREIPAVLQYGRMFVDHANDIVKLSGVFMDVGEHSFNPEVTASLAFRHIRRHTIIHRPL